MDADEPKVLSVTVWSETKTVALVFEGVKGYQVLPVTTWDGVRVAHDLGGVCFCGRSHDDAPENMSS